MAVLTVVKVLITVSIFIVLAIVTVVILVTVVKVLILVTVVKVVKVDCSESSEGLTVVMVVKLVWTLVSILTVVKAKNK